MLWLTDGKAFLKSTKATYRGFFAARDASMAVLRTKGLFSVRCEGRKRVRVKSDFADRASSAGCF